MNLRLSHLRLVVPLWHCAVGLSLLSQSLPAQSPPTAVPPEGYFPGADGVRLFYRILGSGADTVVLLHGGPGTGMREGLDLEPLTEAGHALLLYDQRGSGNSELIATPSKLTLANHVADLEALRRHFGLRRLALIGLSWGSAVALHYGIAYPGSTDRMVFLSPMPPTGRFFVHRFVRLDSLRTADTKARLRTIDSLWPVASDSELPALCRESLHTAGALYQERGSGAGAPRGDVCDYPAPVLRHRRLARIAALTAMGAEYDFAPALERLSIPALVIEGERSKLPLDATRFWARHARRSRLLLIPGAGHRSWLDQPAYLFRAIDDFLGGDWPDGAREIKAE